MDLQEFRAYVRATRLTDQASPASNGPRVFRLPANSMAAWAMTPMRKVEQRPKEWPLGLKTNGARVRDYARSFGVKSWV